MDGHVTKSSLGHSINSHPRRESTRRGAPQGNIDHSFCFLGLA